jgi:HK97 family phage major capsid protein
MTMSALKTYLIDAFGLAAEADKKTVRQFAADKLASGELSRKKYLKLTTPKADKKSPFEKLAGYIDDAVEKRFAVLAIAPQTESLIAPRSVASCSRSEQRQSDSAVQPAEIFAPAAAAAAAQPRVRRASEQYDSTKGRKVYPAKGLDGRPTNHPLAGQDVTFDGRPAYDQSQLERAQSGVWLKHKIYSQLGAKHMLSDHERDLLAELVEKGQWVGDYEDGNGAHYFSEPRTLSEMQRKTYLEDTTSGGTYLVPYFFDVDLVTYPLLYGELFPLVDLRDLGTSNQVKTPTLANLTIAAGPAEGDTPSITLQTTSGLSTVITSNVYNATGALTIGRDMLADTPINLQDAFMQLYQVALLNWLDQAVAIGDGTTYPLGVVNTTGTNTASAKNSTTGPWTVGDIENTVKALPKQYRGRNDKVIFLSADSQYFRLRGIPVSSTDQRRIFGYDLDAYMFYTRPYKVQNGIAAATFAYGRIDKYRMWRRKGMELAVTDDGKTLRLANELLITARSRWAGQVIDPNAWVLMTNAPLH